MMMISSALNLAIFHHPLFTFFDGSLCASQGDQTIYMYLSLKLAVLITGQLEDQVFKLQEMISIRSVET